MEFGGNEVKKILFQFHKMGFLISLKMPFIPISTYFHFLIHATLAPKSKPVSLTYLLNLKRQFMHAISHEEKQKRGLTGEALCPNNSSEAGARRQNLKHIFPQNTQSTALGLIMQKDTIRFSKKLLKDPCLNSFKQPRKLWSQNTFKNLMRRHNEGGCMALKFPSASQKQTQHLGLGEKTFVEWVVEAMLRRKNKGLNA